MDTVSSGEVMRRDQNNQHDILQTENVSREQTGRGLVILDHDGGGDGDERDNKDGEGVGKEISDDEKRNIEFTCQGQMMQEERREDEEVKQQVKQTSKQMRELDLNKDKNVQQQKKEVIHEETEDKKMVERRDEGKIEQVREKLEGQVTETPEEQVRETSEQQQQQLPTYQVEEEEVRLALQKDQGTDAHLESWTCENFTKQGDHFMSCIRRLTITFTLAGNTHQTSYVVKTKQKVFGGCFDDLLDVAFQKECLVYETLVPALNAELREGHLEHIRLPRCYFHCLKEGRQIIILEDLSRCGFKMPTHSLGLDAVHARLVVQELGRLHASSLLYQATLPNHCLALKYPVLQKDWHNYSERAGDELGVIMKSDLLTVAALAEMSGRPKDEVMWLRDLATRTLQVFTRQLATEPPFAVFCHGDCWTNNALFRYDNDGVPVEVKLLDLQMSRRGSVALDLITLMYTSLSGQERRASLTSLLHEYYVSFSRVMEARGVPVPFTLEQLEAEYREKSLFGLLMGSDYLPVVMVKSEDVTDYSLVKDGEEVLMKDRLDKLPGIIQRNPHLVTLLLDLLNDMAHLGILEADQTTHV
ncbi:hypothetical protein Pmani_010501 [Petrolisthes manimaculis]|uniref:CHK kinase-like domain-containing protein n=1 Tax=Petrolisthes manimaculis TaxID=1843537 RepID=A0AAE1Q1K7_9EUCA|nr:hypothetical protein Pmani_010501 [Petrolisthes manimaculis]